MVIEPHERNGTLRRAGILGMRLFAIFDSRKLSASVARVSLADAIMAQVWLDIEEKSVGHAVPLELERLPKGARIPHMLGETGAREVDGDAVEFSPDKDVDAITFVERVTSAVTQDQRIGDEGPSQFRRKNESLGSPAPASFFLIPAGIGSAVSGGAIQGNHPRRVRRPEDLFQVLAEVLAVVEDDVVLHHQVGVGVRMAEDQFAEAEVEIGKGPDRRVAGREGTLRVAGGDRRREIFEDSW
jgi:hypothetical protein